MSRTGSDDRSGDALFYMLLDGRSPGHLGPAVSVRVRTPDGLRTLHKVPGGWAEKGDEGLVLTVPDTAQALRGGAMRPVAYTVEPEFAPLLFVEAVRRASESVSHLLRASAERPKVTFEGDQQGLMAYVMWAGHLDRAMQVAAAGTVMAIAAAEAQINAWAHLGGGWADDEDFLDLPRKCETLAARSKVDLDLGGGPMQELATAVRHRHALVHPKAIEFSVNATGAAPLRSAHEGSLAARRTCLAVRRALLLVARSTSHEPPRYLAYCPDSEAGDDQTWSTAEVMTGVRPDKDFPPSTVDQSDPQGL